MARKPQTQTAAPSLAATKRDAKAPSAPVVTKVSEPAAPTAAPKPAPTVALRGGLAIQSVKLTGKAYRVGAAHNQAWWDQVTQAVAAGNGTATVAELVTNRKVPAIFVGYVVRRGYLQSA